MSNLTQDQQRTIEVLNNEGVMIRTHFKYWQGQKKLTPEMLGLKPETVDKNKVRLGQLRLLGDQAERLDDFRKLANRLSAEVVENSFSFMNGLLRYVPNAKLEYVNGKLDEIISEAQVKCFQFLSDYAFLREQAIQEWVTFAQTLEDSSGNFVFDTAAKFDSFMQRIRDSFPEVSAVERKFAFSYQVVAITVPNVETQTELTNATRHLKLADARNKIIQEEAKKLAAESQQFLRDCLAEVRTGLVKALEEAGATMENGRSKVSQKTLDALRRKFEDFRALNFAGDTQLTRLIDTFERDFLGIGAQEYRDNESALTALRQGMANMAEEAKTLAAQDAADVVANFGKVARRRIQMDNVNTEQERKAV